MTFDYLGQPVPQPPSPSRKKRLAWTLSIIGIILVTGAAIAVWIGLTAGAGEPEAEAPSPAPVETAEPAPDPDPEPAEPIRILAMGDMLPHDSVNAAAQTDSGWDYQQFFAGIESQLAASDAIFCNQEVPSAGEAFGITGYPVFNAPHEFAEDLNAVGCDLVNLANNHTADKGVDGIAQTRSVWDGLNPVSLSGANRSVEEQNTIMYGEVRGVRTALVSFAEYSNIAIDGVSLNLMGDAELVQRLLGEARSNADLVIVSAHWGTEDSHEVNAAQRAYAQMFADLGADVVLGTGPHVLQPVEWLDRPDGGRSLVWYSLGNMLNTQLGLDQLTGVIASFEVVPGEDGAPATVENPTAMLTYMHYDWLPEDRAAGNLLARHNLSITPLAESEELIARTSFGVSVADQFARSAAILGDVVAVE